MLPDYLVVCSNTEVACPQLFTTMVTFEALGFFTSRFSPSIPSLPLAGVAEAPDAPDSVWELQQQQHKKC